MQLDLLQTLGDWAELDRQLGKGARGGVELRLGLLGLALRLVTDEGFEPFHAVDRLGREGLLAKHAELIRPVWRKRCITVDDLGRVTPRGFPKVAPHFAADLRQRISGE